jgi:Ca2+-transporting ATPase
VAAAPQAASGAQPAISNLQSAIVLNAAVNSTANLETRDGALVAIGNSTEGALLHWLHDAHIDYRQLRGQYDALYQMHFSSERKRMTTVIRLGTSLVALVKGAPELLLEHCGHYQASDGTVAPMTDATRTQIIGLLRDAAGQAMRTLAFAYAYLPKDQAADEDSLHAARDTIEKDLIYVGFAAIRDPLRDDVKQAIAECRDAGIAIKMITGDNIETARAIGAEIGLLAPLSPAREAAPLSPALQDQRITSGVTGGGEGLGVRGPRDAIVMTSDEFNRLTDDELKEKLPRLTILARARPLDKYRMVRLLQEQGEVVAVTGDGTNDAPALKKADVGLAMGRAGTEVAKEASKIVILDDSFATIVHAVHWGRALYENIQRFIQFQLTINISALIIAFLGPFFGVKPPFTILQLLWINVIMDTLASIALCSEPPRPGLMKQKPKRRDDSILTPPMLTTIFTTAGFFVIVMLLLLVGLENHWRFLDDAFGTPSRSFPELTYWQVALFFSVYVFFQVWNEINCRSLSPEVSGFYRLFRNWVFLGIVGLIVVVQILIVSVGGRIFEVAPLGPWTWLAVIVATSSVVLYAEVVRQIRLARMHEFTRANTPDDVIECENHARSMGDPHGRFERRPRSHGD